MKSDEGEDNDNQSPLNEAIEGLFDFIDREIEITSVSKKSTMEAYKTQIRALIPVPEKASKTNLKRGRASKVKKHVVQVSNVDSDAEDGEVDSDIDSDEGSFDGAAH